MRGAGPMGLPADVLDRTEKLLTADCTPPALRIPDPSPKKRSPFHVPDVRFDLERVARVVHVAEHLVHIKGDWRGQPIDLTPVQVQHFIAPIYGWVIPHDSPREWVRLRQSGFWDVPRKNAKTTTLAVLAVVALVADDEPSPEVATGAIAEAQARKLYDPARDMMLSSPRLNGLIQSVENKIVVPRNGGEFWWTTPRKAKAEQGGNISTALLDELHVHPTAELLETLETGTGARAQPLVLIITTADEGEVGTVYDERRSEIESMAKGIVDWDPTMYGAIWCIGDTDDPFDEANWFKANPMLGVAKSVDYMRKQARRAQRNPSYRPTFERLDLGLRRRTDVRWLPLDYFTASDHQWSLDDLAGADVWGALDLSAVDDFTALVWWCPRRVTAPAMGDQPARLVDGGVLIPRIWCTESGVRRRPRMARQLEQWALEGWLTITPGDAIDYAAVRAQLLGDAGGFGRLHAVGYDPWNAAQFAQELQDEHGLRVIEVAQTFKQLAAGSQRLEALVLKRAAGTNGNPVFRWMVSNAIARRDPDNRVRPDKKRSGQKIDAISATVTAMAVELADEGLPSFEDQFV